MAKFFPNYQTILKMRVPPTEGELYLLNFLKDNYNDEYEVYFNPYMNGDRPDIIIMRQGGGVLIIEVKDWDLSSYELNSQKQWKVKYNGSITKSPIDQVLQYKENLYDLHIPDLLEKKITDFKYFRIVCCAVYFHKATQNDLQNLLVKPFEEDEKYQNFLKYDIDLIGKDDLQKDKFDTILTKRYINTYRPSFLFTQDLYESFSRFLNPPLHLKEQGKLLNYSDKQKEIIDSSNKIQRIKGVVGSGKTTVLAARAVKAYKNALKEVADPKILILTFNITLKNHIHDKLNQVPEDFAWKSFDILHYHLFINSILNNIGIHIEIPKDLEQHEISKYLDKHYYSNIELFKEHKDKIEKYDAILIDEIQDYKYNWFEILKNYILKKSGEYGEYALSGDVKQNIYNREIKNKDVHTNVKGRPIELKECYRSEQKVKELAILFQKEIYKDRYEIDDFDKKADTQLQFELEKQGNVNYIFLEQSFDSSILYNIIHQSLANQFKGIHFNDVTVLGCYIEPLKEFDAYYCYHTRRQTNTMFETKEIGYKILLNNRQYNINNIYSWGKQLLTKYSPYHQNQINHLAKLLAIYELYERYNDKHHHFGITLENECKKATISVQDFANFINSNKQAYETLKNQSNSTFEKIRKKKKIHFWFNSGTIKISTVHSFKGLESKLVFLILDPKVDSEELIYTGITRSKSDLVIINFANQKYNEVLRKLVDKVQQM